MSPSLEYIRPSGEGKQPFCRRETAVLSVTSSCPSLHAGDAAGREGATAAKGSVTFTRDIAPIVFNNCTSCHRPGQAAPFPFLSYADVKKRGALIAAVTKS